ncbi:MAG: V-type ATPase subunit [Promethearchaeota archaeon]
MRAPLEYSFIYTKIRGLKSKLLTVGDYERLLSASSLSEIGRILNTTNLKELDLETLLLKDPLDLKEIEVLLNQHYIQVTDRLIRFLPRYARNFAESAYRRKAFYDSLKTIIRGVDLQIDKKTVSKYLTTPSEEDYTTLMTLLDSVDVPELISLLLDSRAQQVLRSHQSEYERVKSTLVLEQALTKDYYNTLLKEKRNLKQLDIEGVIRFLNIEIDLLNLTTIIRGKNQNIDEATLRSWIIPIQYRLGDIEKYLRASLEEIYSLLRNTIYRELVQMLQTAFETDKARFEIIDNAINQFMMNQAFGLFRKVPFNLGVLFGFLYLKSMEIRNLRAIIVGKHDEVEANLIRRFIVIF